MAKQERRKPTGIEPSRSLWDRLFGSTPTSPEIEEAIRIMKEENPDLAPIEMYGPLSRAMMGRANAYTSPAGTIYLNPDQLVGKSKQEIADTILHEQTHVGQLGDNPIMNFLKGAYTSLGTPYHARPEEQEAYRTEQARALRQGRIPMATPNVMTGEWNVGRDIPLRERHPITPSETNEERLARLMREPRVRRR